MSAASRVNPGGYYTYPQALEQFTVSDERTVQEIASALKQRGIEPVWKDWDASFDATRNHLRDASFDATRNTMRDASFDATRNIMRGA
jgi:hypothetical protein